MKLNTKPIWSWIFTFLVWTLLIWWEGFSGSRTSTWWIFQFIAGWIYLVSAILLIPPYETREIHNKVFGGKLFSLSSGFYFLPLVMWWGSIHSFQPAPREEKSFIHLDTRELKPMLDSYLNRKVDRRRELKGFWGAVEDFSRQYFGNLKLKDSWWIIVITGILAWQLANYSIWFTKKYYPENFQAKNSYVNTNTSSNTSAYLASTSEPQVSSSSNYSSSEPSSQPQSSVPQTQNNSNYNEEEQLRLQAEENQRQYQLQQEENRRQQEQWSRQQEYQRQQDEEARRQAEYRRQQDEQYARLQAEENEIKRISRASIVFIPHIILNGYSLQACMKYVLNGYSLYSLPGESMPHMNNDGTFFATNSFGSQIHENEVFVFIFACRGNLYNSFSRRQYDGPMSRQYQSDKEMSANLPNYVYIVNGRAFNFTGDPY